MFFLPLSNNPHHVSRKNDVSRSSRRKQEDCMALQNNTHGVPKNSLKKSAAFFQANPAYSNVDSVRDPTNPTGLDTNTSDFDLGLSLSNSTTELFEENTSEESSQENILYDISDVEDVLDVKSLSETLTHL